MALLGSTYENSAQGNEDEFIAQLLQQNKYVEASELLRKESAEEPSTLFNMALCHYWVEQFQETLLYLHQAQLRLPASIRASGLSNNPLSTTLGTKQNRSDGYTQPITKKYVTLFAPLVAEAIIRLKTDCWLRLGNYAKVIEIATPLANKNYKNINEALQVAQNQ